jgi:poly-gamma-glutamate system protein
MVELLKKSGAKGGDIVAVGFSGSFPALNLATFAAAEALELKVIAITSVAASTWGANVPKFTWLDMERVLYRKRLVSQKSVAASLGGQEDRALARSKKGRRLLQEAVERNKVEILEAGSFDESIFKRMDIYQKLAEGKRIAAYVNVGGGTASVGTVVGKELFKPGLNRRPSPAALSVDSVMSKFARDGAPIIHMVRVNDLAEKYGLPKNPRVMPAVGEGHIFTRLEYNLYLVAGFLVMLLFISYIFLRLDIGYRIFAPARITKTPGHPEPMV